MAGEMTPSCANSDIGEGQKPCQMHSTVSERTARGRLASFLAPYSTLLDAQAARPTLPLHPAGASSARLSWRSIAAPEGFWRRERAWLGAWEDRWGRGGGSSDS